MSELAKLGDYVDLLTGYPFKSASYVQDPGGIRLLRGDNVSQGRIRWDGVKRWPGDQYLDFAQYELREGDVVLAMDRPWIEAGLKYARVTCDDAAALLVQRVARLRAKEGLDQQYLLYLVGSPKFTDYVLSVQTGTAVPHISKRQIQEFCFSLPPLATQEAIAAVLGALDDKIALNDRIAVTTRALGMSLFEASLQVGSRESVIADLSTLVARGVAPRYSDEESDLLVVNQRCIRGGRVSLGQARRTTRDKLRSEKLLRMYDVLVNSTGAGTLGRVAIWDKHLECTVDTHVTIVRFDPDKVDPLCAAYGMLKIQPHIEQMGEGSTGQTELSRSKLANLRIRLPEEEKMSSLRPALEELEKASAQALSQSIFLEQMRDALLPKLMSGEIRVRDAEQVVEAAT